MFSWILTELYTHDQKVPLEFLQTVSQHHPKHHWFAFYHSRLYKSFLEWPMNITCLASFTQHKVFGFIYVTACIRNLSPPSPVLQVVFCCMSIPHVIICYPLGLFLVFGYHEWSCYEYFSLESMCGHIFRLNVGK